MTYPKTIFPLTLLLLFLSGQTSQAHNKVVVIPMAGDDVPADSTPTTPVADANTDENDYRLILAPFLQDFKAAVDRTTGLTWQRGGSEGPLSWDAAVSYCQDLEILTTFDWRLPTILELQSIVDYGSVTPAIVEPTFKATAPRYWSSTTSSTTASAAWFVSFSNFGSVGNQTKAASNNVRCVR